MTTLVLSILLVLQPGAAGRPASSSAAPTIDWPDFFASVTTRGLVFSDRLLALEGQRVRLRGYAVLQPPLPGGLLVTRIPYAASDPHEEGAELDVPFDAVGVVWRKGLALPPVPSHPTIEGVLSLGNRTLGGQIVALALLDAVPVVPRTKS